MRQFSLKKTCLINVKFALEGRMLILVLSTKGTEYTVLINRCKGKTKISKRCLYYFKRRRLQAAAIAMPAVRKKKL